MRELKVVGLDVDGKRIICEADDSGEKFILLSDDRLRAAAARRENRHKSIPYRGRGSKRAASQGDSSPDPRGRFRRAGRLFGRGRHRAGREVCSSGAAGALTRGRAGNRGASGDADGPSVLTLLETVTAALIARGLDPEGTNWDAWRNEDGRWTVQLAWKAGLSDNVAHFRFTPGAHGGTVTAFDDAACELIDPDFARPLRPVAARPPTRLRGARATTGARTTPTPTPEPPAPPKPPGAQGQACRCPRGRTCCSGCAPAASADDRLDLNRR